MAAHDHSAGPAALASSPGGAAEAGRSAKSPAPRENEPQAAKGAGAPVPEASSALKEALDPAVLLKALHRPPLAGGEILSAVTAGLAHELERWLDLQNRYGQRHLALWMRLLAGQLGGESDKEEAKPDRRFHSPEWRREPLFDYLRHAYLLNAEWLNAAAAQLPLDAAAKRKVQFFTRQWIEALSPANFPSTNPVVLRRAVETEGESLLRGLRNLLADLEKGRLSMTDESAFEVGRNLAITPGGVIYQNEVMQLIQYAPSTPRVHALPLLIVPPFINKYYILDLQPEDSFVRFAVGNGLTVFLISWRNITPELGHLTWEDYLERAVFQAMEVVGAVAGAPQMNLLGFCVGGTLLATALAVLAARRDERVKCATFLTTMLDFEDPGEISVYIDEAYVARKEAEYREGGVMRGVELAAAFASLRPQDLIWHYVVHNYLLGETPPPFDLLYWNSDGANLPGALYCWYVRHMYLQNELRTPGALTLCGVPVDLGKIRVPTYFLAAKEDHIVPWRAAYASARLLSGRIDFILTASGHIAGVVNPASKNRRNYWINKFPAATPEGWLEDARSVPGSWWKHWIRWIKRRSGPTAPAPARVGSVAYPPLEPAPGSYVKARFE
jgi:polyhydroxyalkanoate synthase